MPSDRFYDLSLRILMAAIAIVLAGSVVLLVQRINKPAAPAAEPVPLTEVEPSPLQRSVPLDTAANTQVLLAPGNVFRCDGRSGVTFSDRPCDTAR